MGKQSMDRWRRGEVRGGRGGLPRIGQVGGPGGGGGSHLLFLILKSVSHFSNNESIKMLHA
jgi:hypothetical protein